jgi:hypothetical protein
MKDKVVAPLSLSGGKQSRISILFMTVTAMTTILEQTALLTGLIFCQCNIFWPGPANMLQHHCQIEFATVWCQVVVFANFCNKVKKFSTCVKSILI